MWSWLAQVFGSTPTCRIAEQWLQEQHPEWWIRASVLAREESRDVVAVFYQEPPDFVRPPPYRLLAVSHDLGQVEELPCTLDSPYVFRNRR